MIRLGGESDVHHHGIFAGLGAATAGVLLAGAGLWALWSRIAEQLGVAFLIAMWIILMAGCLVALAGAGFVCVALTDRARRILARPITPAPTATAIPQAMTATAIPVADLPAAHLLPPAAAELPGAAPLELEAGGNHYSLHLHGAEAVREAIRALGGGEG